MSHVNFSQRCLQVHACEVLTARPLRSLLPPAGVVKNVRLAAFTVLADVAEHKLPVMIHQRVLIAYYTRHFEPDRLVRLGTGQRLLVQVVAFYRPNGNGPIRAQLETQGIGRGVAEGRLGEDKRN